MCLSTCVTFVSANFYISLYICWKKIIFKIINTRHFDTSNYITNRRSPSSKSNKWTITNSVISLIVGISILGWKNKNCVTKTLFINFTRRNCFPKYGRIDWFIIRKIRSHAKFLHFCELNMKAGKSYPCVLFPSPLFSRSLLCVLQS